MKPSFLFVAGTNDNSRRRFFPSFSPFFQLSRSTIRHVSFALIYSFVIISSAHESQSASSYPSSRHNNDPGVKLTRPVRIPGQKFEADIGGMDDCSVSWKGFGREFDLFDTRRGGASASDLTADSPYLTNAGAATPTRRQFPYGYDGSDGSDVSESDDVSSSRVGGSDVDVDIATPDFGNGSSSWLRSRSHVMNHRPRGGGSGPVGSGTSRIGAKFRNGPNIGNGGNNRPYIFQTVQDWWTTTITPNVKYWPKIQCRVEPTTTLKIRKTFRPLKTIFKIGADFNTQLGVWQFKSSWEDAIIGGKLTWVGRELQLTKSWQISVGAVEDLVTRLRFRAAVDLHTWKAYARVGFRTERLSPINVVEGFTILKQLPLDGNNGHVKLEVKANFALPEPEIEYSTESQHRSMVGMGDIEVNIDELNLLLDY